MRGEEGEDPRVFHEKICNDFDEGGSGAVGESGPLVFWGTRADGVV